MALGKKTGGGSRKGKPNKRTAALDRAQAEAAEKIAGALGADAFPGGAHDLLMSVYKDTTLPMEQRIDAAKAAIGYERPRLATVNSKVEGSLTLEQLVLGVAERRLDRENGD